jgi:hypothetical protein
MRAQTAKVGTTAAGAVWLIDFLSGGPLALPADLAMGRIGARFLHPVPAGRAAANGLRATSDLIT